MADPAALRTVAEASGYRRTALHVEVLAFLRALAAKSDLVRVASMGKSGLGQDLAVAVLSDAGAFTPEAARAAGAPIVLVIANIHAGEVEGKEAVLALARDLVLGDREPSLRGVTLLLVPNYNPDGNDRVDRAHRARDLVALVGQDGPEGGVGTRTTGRGINLNRDYAKQEAVETRHLAAFVAAWRPHVVVDCHSTDGSIHGYDLTYDTSRNLASCPPGPAVYARDVLLPDVTRRTFDRAGLRTWFYGNYPDPDDPASGWETYPPLARYGSHYRGLLGCVDVLLEAYSYADFASRIRVTYEVIVEILAHVAREGTRIVALVERAAAETVARGARPAPDDLVGVDYGVEARRPDGSLVFRHPGASVGDVPIEAWDLASQRERRVPGRERTTYRGPYFGAFAPTASVRRPFGYVIPAARASIVERIAGHALEHAPLARDVEASVEAYEITSREATTLPDVGEGAWSETVFRVRARLDVRTLRAGDVFVPCAQRGGNLAIYLLEPHADDGLARWGHFDDLSPGDEFPVLRVPAPFDVPA